MSAQLDASENHWKAWLVCAKPFLDLSSDIIICLTPAYKIIEFSRAAGEHYSWQRNDVIGKDYVKLCQSNNISTWLLENKNKPSALLTNEISETTTHQTTNELTTIKWSGTYLYDPIRQPFGLLIVGRKISQNLDAQKQVKILNNYLETIIDAIPGSIYWKDKAGVYLGCNKVIVNKGNLESKTDIIGKTDYDVWPEYAENIQKNDMEVMESGKTLELEETVILPATGERMYFASVKTPLKDENGVVIGIVGNSLDITELKEAKEKAEIANHAKTQFLAVASHELRVPLTGIITVGSMLANGSVSTPNEVQEFGKIMLDAGTYLLSNVNSILEFAKLEVDKFNLKFAPFDLKLHIEEVVTMLTASANSKGLDLSINYESDVPHNIFSDSRVLRHILANLINNAIKYTHQGSIIIKVSCLKQTPQTAQLEIAVEDTGIGIPADKFDFIFDRFSQLEDAYVRSSSRGGIGLGLSIVKKLVQLLNGTINVKSEISKGSTFYFVAEFQLQDQPVGEMPWSPYASTTRILVVDDTLRGEIICNHTATTNCEAIHSDQVLDTLLTSQQCGEPYDIIIIDQQLHDNDAASLLQKINQQKNLKKPLPILLTSSGSIVEKQHANQEGFFATIVKPIQPIAFQTALTTAWEKWIEQRDKDLTANTEETAMLKVLLIEDDIIVQLVEKKMLINMGCEVDIADTGAKAIEMSKNDYDLIFADIGLPDIKGYDVIKAIRQVNDSTSKTPIVVITGNAGDEEKQLSLAAGANEVLTKPVIVTQMENVISRYKPDRQKTL